MLHEEHEQVCPDPDLMDNYACINSCCTDKNQKQNDCKCKSPPPLLAEMMTYPGWECRAMKLKEDLLSLTGGLGKYTKEECFGV